MENTSAELEDHRYTPIEVAERGTSCPIWQTNLFLIIAPIQLGRGKKVWGTWWDRDNGTELRDVYKGGIGRDTGVHWYHLIIQIHKVYHSQHWVPHILADLSLIHANLFLSHHHVPLYIVWSALLALLKPAPLFVTNPLRWPRAFHGVTTPQWSELWDVLGGHNLLS